MPVPIIIGTIAALSGLIGTGAAIHGGVKMKEANDTAKCAEKRYKANIEYFKNIDRQTNYDMDKLGKKEIEILDSFSRFSEIIEQVKNKPRFGKVDIDGVDLPEYDGEELEKVYVGAGVILGGLGGAALGTAGGLAASGATTAAVMALGTASTGTAISTLSGAAATNATLAWLGGGAIAAGGGGMAVGTAVLGGATLGVGLLIGGIIFSITGGKLSDKADEAWEQMLQAEQQIISICSHLKELSDLSNKYFGTLCKVDSIYRKKLDKLINIVEVQNKKDWTLFSNDEKTTMENTVNLVKLLKLMCEVKLVIKAESNNEMGQINKIEAETKIRNAETVLRKVA